MVVELEDRLETSSDILSKTGNQSTLSTVSLEQVRTLWRQWCSYTICLKRIPKHAANGMRFQVYSMSRQHNKLRAWPLDIVGWPQSSSLSQHATRGRFPSTRKCPIETRRQH